MTKLLFQVVLALTIAVVYGSAAPEPKPKPGVFAAAYTVPAVSARLSYSAPYVAPAAYYSAYSSPYAYPFSAYAAYSAPLVLA